jgi:hypothetical protein
MLRRVFGTIDDIDGGRGVQVQADGSFENMTHPGIGTAEFTENSAPDGDGRLHSVGRFGAVRLDLTQGGPL